MKITEEILGEIKRWIEELRSGNWKQGKGVLQYDLDRFCCLGVACMTFIPKNKRIVNEKRILMGCYPYQQPICPEWLEKIDQDFEGRTGTKLSTLNDQKQYSFSQIADVLEKVYVNKEVINLSGKEG